MLEVLKEHQFNNYIDYIYSLAINPQKSSYPCYSDGIKTKEDFVTISKGSFEKDNENILIFKKNDVVKGWVHYYTLPEDKYLTFHSFQSDEFMTIMFEEFLEYVNEKYPTFDLWMGFPKDNNDAISFLKSHGFEMIERSHNMVFHLNEKSKNFLVSKVDKLKLEEYEEFRKLHDQIDCDMYWNSDRIYERFDRWNILVFRNEFSEIQSALYYIDIRLMVEVFGTDYINNQYDSGSFEMLVKKCINECVSAGAKHLVYFVNDNEYDVLKKIGFDDIGEYQCYLRRAKKV